MWLSGLNATDSSFQTAGTTITAHSTIHTKGSWVSVVASAPFDVTWLGVTTSDSTHTSATNTAQLLDIGVGAAASELVLIANIPSGYSAITMPLTNAAGRGITWFPVEIPSGTNISARMQATITVDTCDVRLFMLGSSPWQPPTFQSIDTIGAVIASSAGTDLSGGGIVELTSSTAEDYKAIGWVGDLGAGGALGGEDRLIEIFVGAGAAEKTLVDNIEFSTGSTESVTNCQPRGFFPVEMNIPSGSRLSAQATGGAGRDVGIVLYGFR